MVRLFDASAACGSASPKKICRVERSLAGSAFSGILVNTGHLLEDLVFMALRRVTSDILHYKPGTGREAGFAARLRDGSRMLVQVCEPLASPRTRQREVAELRDAMADGT